MKKVVPIFLIINFFISLCLSGPDIHAEVSNSTNSQVTVKLFSFLGNQSSINVSITGKYLVEDGSELSGTYVVKAESGQLVLYKDGKVVKNYGTAFTVSPAVYNTQNIISINGRKYLGTMKFTIENAKYVRPYNTLPLEDYLKGVVSQEMSPLWGNIGGLDALMSQAIAARTYAQEPGPIDDGETDQVYTGFNWYETTNLAVEATQGLVLKYNGKIIGGNALYSSSNGGKVLSKVNTWGKSSWNYVPFLQVKEDPYDKRSSSLGNHNVDWNYYIHKNQIDLTDIDFTKPEEWWAEKKEISTDTPILTNIKLWLQTNQPIDKKYEIKVVSIPQLSFDVNVPDNETIDGQITIMYMLKDGSKNEYVMEDGKIKVFSKTIETSAYKIRTIIGSKIMKSPYIKSVHDDGMKITVNGGGWGHGIGMSQYGAFQMSKEGKTFNDILSFYYPGTIVEDVIGPTVSNLQTTVSDQTISFGYTLDEDSTTTISLNDPQKSVVVDKQQPKGTAQITWDAGDLATGKYVYTVTTKDKNSNSTTVTGSFIISNNPKEPVKEDNVPMPDSTTKQEPVKLKLTAPATYLYNSPSSAGRTKYKLGPQTVIVLSRKGDWYQVKTWLGPKWIQLKTESKPTEPIRTKDSITKLTLMDRTKLYSSPNLSKYIGSSLAPQSVKVVEQKGEWYKIKTSKGDKWIKPNCYSIPTDKKITLTKKTNLYNSPFSQKAVNSISPQKVNAIAEMPNTGWYQIKTWIGPKWVLVKK